MLKLKLQYFITMQRTNPIERPNAGKDQSEGEEVAEDAMALDGINHPMDMNLGKTPGDDEGLEDLAC